MTKLVEQNLPKPSSCNGFNSSNEKVEVAEIVQAVFGCKWSLPILRLIRQGTCRPGAIERNLYGLTSRVKNYYFHRMIDLGLLERVVYSEIPPRVEYHLTPLSRHLIPIIDSIENLQCELDKNPNLLNNQDSKK
jgi:DNA-binding HxlR family transcriptional regulator